MHFYFNPLPRKEGDSPVEPLYEDRDDFNPLPRKEGDKTLAPAATSNEGISIHSLVKRETFDTETVFGYFVPEISIHSLVKRETACNRPRTSQQPNFNPLPRKEGDCPFTEKDTSLYDFNPLPRKEGDCSKSIAFRSGSGFQSTPS